MIRTQTRSSSIYSADDPLALALKPPVSETDIERQTRILAELEAKRISDRIDEEIRLERESKRKAPMEVKVCTRAVSALYAQRLLRAFRTCGGQPTYHAPLAVLKRHRPLLGQ